MAFELYKIDPIFLVILIGIIIWVVRAIARSLLKLLDEWDDLKDRVRKIEQNFDHYIDSNFDDRQKIKAIISRIEKDIERLENKLHEIERGISSG